MEHLFEKMEHLIDKNYLKIMELFYNNRNTPLHLREIARNVKLNESSISRHLNFLEKTKILESMHDGNLKKFKICKKEVSKIFPIFDDKKLEKLPLLRRNAIKDYIEKSAKKPLFLIVFGSTAKGIYGDTSDIDLLEIVPIKKDTKATIKEVEAITGMQLQIFQMNEQDFEKELKNKDDKVVQSAIKTGFPVYNQKSYYEMILNE